MPTNLLVFLDRYLCVRQIYWFLGVLESTSGCASPTGLLLFLDRYLGARQAY